MPARKSKRTSRTRPASASLADRKIQPKLRMIANGDKLVNTLRAEHCAAVIVKDEKFLDKNRLRRGSDAVPVETDKKAGKKARAKPAVAASSRPPRDIHVNVFIETADLGDRSVKTPRKGAKSAPGGKKRTQGPFDPTGRKANIATAEVSLADLSRIARDPNVTYIELGEALNDPKPHVVLPRAGRPTRPRCPAKLSRLHQNGKGVLIGIIDVQGFDFAHEDFLYKDKRGRRKTRFVSIWDQGAETPAGERPPFKYGLEYDEKALNRALRDAPKARVPPHLLAPQTQMVEGSHGTHVASIAAGRYGVCPEGDIAAVLISLPAREPGAKRKGVGGKGETEKDADYRHTFYDSTRIVHAVDHLLTLAEARGQPISINISLGTNGHAHDASSAVSRWVDAALAVPGRCVCVSSGNVGQEAPAFEGDRNYFTGRIHTSGKLPSAGLTTDIEWLVVGNTISDISENEFEIWYGPQDRFEVRLRPPRSDRWYGPVKPGRYIQNLELPDGTFLSIYNELYHPANGSNYISIYLSPRFSRKGAVGVAAGQWTVRLHGLQVRDGSYHGWIERDDPRPMGRRVAGKEAWSFPSFFSQRSNVDDTSIGSLACGYRVISVANLDAEAERINASSSQGPTRDGRFKPDVAAPGTNIVAAKGFAGPDAWIKLSGTSMSSPFVAGVVGLMLAAQKHKNGKNLTAAQVEGIIRRTSLPLPGAAYTWANDAGFGRINVSECIAEAAAVNDRAED